MEAPGCLQIFLYFNTSLSASSFIFSPLSISDGLLRSGFSSTAKCENNIHVKPTYSTHQKTQAKEMRDNSVLMHIKMWETSPHLEARQRRKRQVFISWDAYLENCVILGLVGDQLEEAKGNLRRAGIRDTWMKPSFQAEPRLAVYTRRHAIEGSTAASSLQTGIKLRTDGKLTSASLEQ